MDRRMDGFTPQISFSLPRVALCNHRRGDGKGDSKAKMAEPAMSPRRPRPTGRKTGRGGIHCMEQHQIATSQWRRVASESGRYGGRHGPSGQAGAPGKRLVQPRPSAHDRAYMRVCRIAAAISRGHSRSRSRRGSCTIADPYRHSATAPQRHSAIAPQKATLLRNNLTSSTTQMRTTGTAAMLQKHGDRPRPTVVALLGAAAACCDDASTGRRSSDDGRR